MDTLELSKYKYVYKVIVDPETGKYNIYKYPIAYISKKFVYYPENGELVKIYNERINDLHGEFVCIKCVMSRTMFDKENTYYYISYKKVDIEQIEESISQIINKVSTEEKSRKIKNLEKKIEDLKSQIGILESQIDMLSADLKKQKEDMVKMKHIENIKLVEELLSKE